MLFATPTPSSATVKRLRELDALRAELATPAGPARRWSGVLRRSFRAADVAASTGIEGFTVTEADVLALRGGRRPDAVTAEDAAAALGYARAMDHVSAMVDDEGFHWCDRVLKDLHFDATGDEWERRPGRWRRQPVSVTAPEGGLAYRGPDAGDVPALVGELVAWLRADTGGDHVVVRAAMAHLHLVSIHPFEDGNGRVSRILQSLVLARDGALPPELGSIEEYLGEHTAGYYAVLRKVQGGSYQPDRDAAPWVRFCVDAHLAQARRRLDLLRRAARRWSRLEAHAEERGWPDRLVVALEQALHSGTDRASYVRETDISVPTASIDLRRLVDAGLLAPEGRGRSIRYRPTPTLRDLAADD